MIAALTMKATRKKILQVACKANFEVSCTKLMQWSYRILI